MPNISCFDFDSAPSEVALTDDDVHIWRVPLDVDAVSLQICRATLSADEQARAARYRRTIDQYHFICGRGRLRQLLGRYVNVSPAALAFTYSPYGKPAIAGKNGAPALQFNLAHSGGQALYAFTRHHPIGIDIEAMRDDIEFEALTQTVFSPAEQAEWRSLPQMLKKQGFYRAWASKEAFIKAIGLGLSFPLQDFDVRLHPAQPAALLAVRSPHFYSAEWSLCDVSVAPNYFGALCLREPNL